jgi:hypothetical protein
MYFSRQQISLVNRSFETAEGLVRGYFRLKEQDLRASRYDIRTLIELDGPEVSKCAFAHLCRYQYERPEKDACSNYLYRICLQDDRILDAVDRGKTFIKLYPLLLYIATHELVHVVRFGQGESDFDAPEEEKMREEERVHTITRNMLNPRGKPDLGLVLECFSNEYIFNA